MIIALLFALALGGLGWRMLINPKLWVANIVQFGQWQHFHRFESTSRLLVGALFIAFSASTGAPAFFNGFGYFLILVALGLMVFGEQRHRDFAVHVCPKFEKWYPFGGIVAMCLSLVLLNYSGLFPSIL